jgi:biotin operon repressor
MTKKPTSKVDTVIALVSAKAGTTIDAISKKLSVSRTASASLIADARAKGVKIKYDVESGRYYA